jgi:hypothetical protein
MHDQHDRVVRGTLIVRLCVLSLAISSATFSSAAADGLEAPPGVLAEMGAWSDSVGGGWSAGSDDDSSGGLGGGSGPAAAGAPPLPLPRNATFIDQSAYAMGRMTWNVIMIESNGAIDVNQENWTPAEIATIQTEIGQAQTFWEGLTAGFHPGARLSIDIHYETGEVPLETGYEPIRRSSGDENRWINEAMDTLGYNDGNHFNNVRNYNNDRRIADGNHWATTIFIVDDTVDSDNRFSNSAFAYA